MKITDFGLWFLDDERPKDRPKEWFTAIPQAGGFAIYYDGNYLGYYHNDDSLLIYDDKPHSINLNKYSPLHGGYLGRSHYTIYTIGRRLTMDDFEIIPNPDYKGNK